MINITEDVSRKRVYDHSEEFMPLSNSSLFGDDVECNWGFKKLAKKSTSNDRRTQIEAPEVFEQHIYKKDVYKAEDPLRLKEDDKLIYLENLTKIYQKNHVYIPSFHEMDNGTNDIISNIDIAIKKTIDDEAKHLASTLDELWMPLYESYVITNRLSINCSAYKMIMKGVEEYSKAKKIYEDCNIDFEANAKNFIEVANVWSKMNVDMLTNVFKNSVGETLLKYKDDINVTLDSMAKKESNIVIFTRMVTEDVSLMKSRVDKVIKKRKVVIEETPEDGKVFEDTKVSEGRPITNKAMKNRGLTPHRNKLNKNPRTKHRMKFKKAVVKQQNLVPRERMDEGNYQGEKNGIRKDIVKARKIK